MNSIRLLFLTILCTIPAFPIFAGQLSSQQLSASIGSVEETNTDDDDSPAFQINYGAPLNKYLLYTISHYNEAQLESPKEGISRHKRDGLALQLWGALPVTERFVVRAGVGPYLFFDTQVAEGDVSFKQTHGVVPLYSLAASYDFDLFNVPSFVQFTVNQTGSRDGFETRSYLLGLGVYFDQPDKETSTVDISRGRRITFLGGVTYENGLDNGSGPAFSLEYSQRINHYLSWSAAVLRENGPIDDLERTGAVGQLWLKSRLTDRFDIGLGAGPAYFSGPTEGAGVFSVSADYALSENWDLGLRFNRIATGDNLESDDILLGISRKF